MDYQSGKEALPQFMGELEKIARSGNVDLNVELEFAASTGHAVNYTLKKIAAEYLTEDSIPIAIRLSPWDVDRDGIVGISDLAFVGQYLGVSVASNLDPNPDVNSDGRVDILDVVIVATHFGEVYLSASSARDVYTFDPDRRHE